MKIVEIQVIIEITSYSQFASDYWKTLESSRVHIRREFVSTVPWTALVTALLRAPSSAFLPRHCIATEHSLFILVNLNQIAEETVLKYYDPSVQSQFGFN